MKVQKDCAILIGNGINNYAKLPYSWKKLLLSLTESEKIINSIKTNFSWVNFCIVDFEKCVIQTCLKPNQLSNFKSLKC